MNPFPRPTSLTALVLAALGALAPCQQRANLAESHVRVIWTGSPQTEAVVSWTTSATAETNVVFLARTRDVLEGQRHDEEAPRQVVAAQLNGAFSAQLDDGSERHYHHVRLTGLQPASEYWILPFSGRGEPDTEGRAAYRFRTAPADGHDFAILSGGDSRSDPDTRRKMNERIAALANARPEILAFAHGGDYVANGLDLDQWDRWLFDNDATELDENRLLPIIPARGNHEGRGALYDELWAWPGGTDAINWFATELSRDVLLISLNSETSAGGDQRDFLEATLKAHADTRFKLVQYHRPLFPAVKSPGRAKSHWQPLFDEHRVDLVLESDGHVLKRTVPIRGDARDDEQGVVYIGEGGLGVPQRKADTDRWFLQEPGFAKSAHHVWVVTFTDDGLALEAIGLDGEILDRHTIRAQRARKDG